METAAIKQHVCIYLYSHLCFFAKPRDCKGIWTTKATGAQLGISLYSPYAHVREQQVYHNHNNFQLNWTQVAQTETTRPKPYVECAIKWGKGVRIRIEASNCWWTVEPNWEMRTENWELGKRNDCTGKSKAIAATNDGLVSIRCFKLVREFVITFSADGSFMWKDRKR